MAQSMILDMLKTPQQVREEQLAKLRQRSTSQAQLLGAPVSATTALPGLLRSFAAGEMAQQGVDMNQIARRASTAAGSVAGMLGYGDAQQALSQAFVSPEERQAGQAQSIMKGLDPNDPAAMKEAADQLASIGLTGAATRLSERAEGIVDRLRTRGFQDTAEARAAADEARAVADEKRRVAEELRQEGRTEREIQDWMEANKDRLLQRVRAEKAERRAKSEEQRKQEEADFTSKTRKSALGIADDEQAMIALGINPTLAKRIKESQNKNAYIQLISERMKAYGEDPTGGADDGTTAEQNLERMTGLIKQRQEAQSAGDDALAQQLGTQITVLGGILGLNSSQFEKVIVDSLEAQQKASALDTKASNLIAKIDSVKVDMKSGVPARADEALKTIFGSEDPITVLRTEYNNIRNSSVLQYLPPGVASDRDVALVLEGTLPSTSNPEAMMSFLRGVQKVAAAERQYHQERLNYLAEPTRFGNPAGFVAQYETKQRNARKQQLLDLGYNDTEASKYSETPLAFSKAVQAQATGGSRLDNLESRLQGL